jgi:hypothetical protein
MLLDRMYKNVRRAPPKVPEDRATPRIQRVAMIQRTANS